KPVKMTKTRSPRRNGEASILFPAGFHTTKTQTGASRSGFCAPQNEPLRPISLVAVSCFDGRGPGPGEGNAPARFHQNHGRRSDGLAGGCSRAAATSRSSSRRADGRSRDAMVTGLAHRVLASARPARVAGESQPVYAGAMVE